MKKMILLSALLFSFNGWAENTTIVCLLDGESDESTGIGRGSREIKLQQTIIFDSKSVSSFNNLFLTDYDFLEYSTLNKGLEKGMLEITSSVTENEIVFSIRDKGNYYTADNSEVNWVIYDLTINRKSGVAKTSASYAHTINESDIVRYSYSAFGNCNKSKNKF
tara:strand:+ start:135 stop:626 length:492 start_codon:yes stop_codon:yes gene_type:complete